jgi:hypothetical protein
MVVHNCNPSTQEAKHSGGLRVWGQLGLHSETVSKKSSINLQEGNKKGIKEKMGQMENK